MKILSLGLLLIIGIFLISSCTSGGGGFAPRSCGENDPDTLYFANGVVFIAKCVADTLDTTIVIIEPNIDDCIEGCLEQTPKGKKHVLECVRECVGR